MQSNRKLLANIILKKKTISALQLAKKDCDKKGKLKERKSGRQSLIFCVNNRQDTCNELPSTMIRR